MNTFEESGIRPELKKAVLELGFETIMPVQEQVIPVVLESKDDIIALAQTGTGKTAAFGLPVLSLLDLDSRETQALILSPTRELCIQITKDLMSYGKYLTGLRVTAVYGGASIENQISQLKSGAHVIVATPGRMNDLIRRKRVFLSNVQTVVLDEADEMLNMGFTEDLNLILEKVPAERRTLLFSATMSNEVASIAKNYMHTPVNITIGKKNSGAENVSHHAYIINAKDRYLVLKRIVDYYPEIYGIIFCRTRLETAEIAEKLMKDGYNADALHGDLSQTQRDYAMQRFRSKNLQILVATDVAARGLDVDNITHVINYNLPDDNEIYTHRSGRTGRAGKTGISISLTHVKEKFRLQHIEKMIGRKFETKQIPGGKDICKKQLFNMIDKMENVDVNEDEITIFLPALYEKLAHLEKEEIIKRFVSLEFNRFLDYYQKAPDLNLEARRSNDERRDRPERNERGDRNERRERSERGDRRDKAQIREASAFTVLRVNMGSADGLEVRELIGMVNNFTQDRSIAIGRAEIRPYFTLFGVDSTSVNQVLKSFDGQRINNRELIIEVARESDQHIGGGGNRGERRSDGPRKPRNERPFRGNRRS
jgi:ATP-dependent RNA helicase DeaD